MHWVRTPSRLKMHGCLLHSPALAWSDLGSAALAAARRATLSWNSKILWVMNLWRCWAGVCCNDTPRMRVGRAHSTHCRAAWRSHERCTPLLY